AVAWQRLAERRSACGDQKRDVRADSARSMDFDSPRRTDRCARVPRSFVDANRDAASARDLPGHAIRAGAAPAHGALGPAAVGIAAAEATVRTLKGGRHE